MVKEISEQETPKERSRSERFLYISIAVAFIFIASACNVQVDTTTSETPYNTYVTVTPPDPTSEFSSENNDFAAALKQSCEKLIFPQEIEIHRPLVNKVLGLVKHNSYISPDLVLAIMQQESNGDNSAQSSPNSLGATGLMQIANYWSGNWAVEQPDWLISEMKSIGNIFSSEDKISEAQINEFIGTNEGQLAVAIHMIDEGLLAYDGNVYATLAYYNGGIYPAKLWFDWSEYAIANGIDPLDTGNKQYLDYKQVQINKFVDLLLSPLKDKNLAITDLDRQAAEASAEEKFSESRDYATGIITGLLSGEIDDVCLSNKINGMPICKSSNEQSETAYTYTVKPGDILSVIAQEHGTTVEQIKRDNYDITDPDMIQVGQKLTIR